MCGDYLVQQALGRFAGHDDPIIAGTAEEADLDIESQLSFSMILIRSVALNAVIRQNWPHMHPKPNLPRHVCLRLAKYHHAGQH